MANVSRCNIGMGPTITLRDRCEVLARPRTLSPGLNHPHARAAACHPAAHDERRDPGLRRLTRGVSVGLASEARPRPFHADWRCHGANLRVSTTSSTCAGAWAFPRGSSAGPNFLALRKLRASPTYSCAGRPRWCRGAQARLLWKLDTGVSEYAH